MGMAEYGGAPEFFVSRVQHIEDMRNGNMRVWYCVDRTTPEGVVETDTVLTVIMPVSAIPDAVAQRQAVFGKSSEMLRTSRSRAFALAH